ncbi:MAG: NAD-dependent epimerase/dehydratase family protein [Sedimentisphaerales bacterium]|nr:NAD-dependent epimerase/dehydratase family protein [Sedimentisphaerales bacterium]
MQKANVLITGVAGFIGSNLADRLCSLDGYKVTGIDNLAYGVREQVPDAVEFHKVDIRSKAIYPLFENVDYVFHLAAKNCISDCQADPVETADVNVTGTVNVFEAARRAGVKKVIYAESSALYEASTVFPTPEAQVKPESFYAASKVASMYFADSFGRFSDLRFTALRYFCVYGPRQDYRRNIPPVMSAFIIKLLKGENPVIYGTGDKRRDFVYVDDVNDFHLLCMNKGVTDGRAFNIGSGENYSVNEIYQMIAELLNVRVSPLHRPDLPGEAVQTLADVTNARRLGWSPKTAIKDGLKDMIDFIRREFQKGNIK